MLARILNNLQIYLGNEYTGKQALFTLLINRCIAHIKTARNYPSDYTETMISADLDNYEFTIFDLVLSAYNKMGIEGESSHSENGISASFIEDEKNYNGILPIARVI